MKNDNFFPFFTFSATLPTFKIYGNSYTFCHTSLRKDTITLAFSKISYFCKKQNVSRKVGTKHILESQKWPSTPPYPLTVNSICSFWQLNSIWGWVVPPLRSRKPLDVWPWNFYQTSSSVRRHEIRIFSWHNLTGL